MNEDGLFGSDDEFEAGFEDEAVSEVEEVQSAEPENSEEADKAEEADASEASVETKEQAQPDPKSPVMLPLAAVKAEREKAQLLKAQVEALQAQLEQFQSANPHSFATPDPVLEPEAYHARVRAEAASDALEAIRMERFQHSVTAGEAKYGADAIKELSAWGDEQAAADPTFIGRVLSQPDPVEFAWQLRDQQQQIESYLANPSAFQSQMGVSPELTSVAPTPKGPASINELKSRSSEVSSRPANWTSLFD